ncbi:hypothetical protein [Novosphingobium endophyticum]|nr:hypothetical protein [Novosphingobium endophyticum]
MKAVCELNPSKNEVTYLPEDTELSFLPMEAIGERGELDLSRTRPIGEVSNGYSYFADGDVVFAKVTPCFENGKGALIQGLIGGRGFGTTEVTVLRPKQASDAHFLRWLTVSRIFRDPATGEMQGAGGLKRVPESFVASFKVPWPPSAERNSIATFLDRETAKIDALVAEQERLIALLKEKRQAVISHAVTKGLNPHAPMKGSGIEWLGQIPAHWDVKRLRHVASLNPSKSEIADWEPETEVSFLPMEAIGEDGGLSLERTRPIADVLTGYTYFHEGDVTVAKITPCFENGKGAVMQQLVQGVGFGTTELIVVRPHQDFMSSAYLDWIFRSQPFRALGEGSMYGAGGQKRVPDDFVRNFAIGFPPRHEQTEIIAYLDRLARRFDQLAGEAQSAILLLQERRAALISAAVTGKIDVRGVTSQSNVISIDYVRPASNLPTLRAVVGAYAIRELGPMGRMAVMKAGYLAEGHAGFGDLNGRYERYAAGPYDSSLIEAMQNGAWESYGILTNEPRDEGKPVTYNVPKDYQPPFNALSALVGEDRARRFLALLSLLKGIGRDGVEAVATLYAVWNDLLAASKTADSDTICNGVLNDWHPEKTKKFKRADLDHWLAWMHRNNFVPDGTAPSTHHQGDLFA